MTPAGSKAKPSPKSKSKPKAKPSSKPKPSKPSRSAKPAAKPKAELAPFPFFGQGDAGYYEWFEIWIWFEENVPKTQRRALLEGAPRLCTLDAQWPHGCLLWASTGDQWIQQHLVEEYGTAAAKKKMEKATARHEQELAGEYDGDGDDDDDDYLDDLIAGGGETKAFNAEIEVWLRAMHEKRRILFAARREDGEAGGTRLGRWHKRSLEMFDERVLPALEALAAEPKLDKEDLRRAPIGIALGYLGERELKAGIRKLGERE